jgi:adenine phosphoribosyltransferase
VPIGFRDELLRRFTWIDGHADVLGLFADAGFLAAAARALANPFRAGGITKVAAVEARGFVLGTGVALDLNVGFVPIRKSGSVHPGPKATRQALRDWRGNEPELSVQRAALSRSDRVLLVDDWIETGNQALTARELIEECGAVYGGLSVLVDQSEDERRRELAPLAAVVRHDALPPVSSSLRGRELTLCTLESGGFMSVYLMRFSYTPETWSRLLQNPEDRRDAARAYIEQVGGALHGFWYGFGRYDGYALFEAPDDVSMAAVVLAISAGGALASVETTVLMTVEETLEALAKGKDIGYRRPGESGAT